MFHSLGDSLLNFLFFFLSKVFLEFNRSFWTDVLQDDEYFGFPPEKEQRGFCNIFRVVGEKVRHFNNLPLHFLYSMLAIDYCFVFN